MLCAFSQINKKYRIKPLKINKYQQCCVSGMGIMHPGTLSTETAHVVSSFVIVQSSDSGQVSDPGQFIQLESSHVLHVSSSLEK